jgi:O-antigen ligase
VITLGLLVSRSWLAWFCFLAGTFYLSQNYFSDDVRRRLRTWGVASLAFFVLIGLGYKGSQVMTRQSYNPSARFLYWQAALTMWKEHPIRGIGIGAYDKAYRSYKPGPGENSRLAHSFPLQVAAEMGSLGILAFGWMMWSVWRRRHWGSAQSHVAVTIILLFSMATIYMDFFLSRLMLALWLAIWIKNDADVPQRFLRPLWALVLAGLLVTAASFWLKLFRAEQLFVAGKVESARELNPRL